MNNESRRILRLILAFLFFPLPVRAADDYSWLTYDNCDGDHASISIASFPGIQVLHTTFGPQLSVLAGRNVLGNASVAYTSGDFWGSVARNAYMNPGGATAGYNQYTNNHAYWHPEHLDHDAKDHYHAMTPVVNNSQGSSGSEIDEMHKWLQTMNAFTPTVREKLVSSKLLMPTMQMLARRSRVADDAAYLTGAAHPNAFDNATNQAAMIAMAAGIQADNVPPFVKIRVEQDDFNGVNGVDFFDSGGSERFYDTPVSICRLFRGRRLTHSATLNAEDSYDANGRPLTYHWSVLRGNTDAVRITPLNASGSRVRVEVDYHAETTIPGSSRLTNLVSVGAFVHNGTYYSPPAFFTSFTMANETRTYSSGRLQRSDYTAVYVSPSLSYPKAWSSDEFHYDGSGNLTGWTRTQGTQTNDFTPEGYLVVELDQSGRVLTAQRVVYSVNATIKKLEWRTTGNPFPYEGDSGKPSIVWSEPTEGAILEGTRTVSATITDPDGIASVVLRAVRATPVVLRTFSSGPYSYAWDTSAFPEGPVTLEFEARDNASKVATSQRAVTIRWARDKPPQDLPQPNVLDPQNRVVCTDSLEAWRLFDRRGQHVRSFSPGECWDGRNSEGESVVAGRYPWKADDGKTGSFMKIR